MQTYTKKANGKRTKISYLKDTYKIYSLFRCDNRREYQWIFVHLTWKWHLAWGWMKGRGFVGSTNILVLTR